MARLKKNSKILIFCAIIAVILILNHIFGWSETLGKTESLDFLSEMIRDHFIEAAILYIAITVAACVVLALPGVTFAIVAGVIFGPWWGTLFCLIATTLGAVIAFIVGRFFLKDSIKPMLKGNRLLKRILFDEVGRSDIVLLAITRLVPLFPYNIQNFAYGITDISLGHYSLYTFIFMIPGVALYTIGAAGLTAGADRFFYFVIAAGLLLLVLFLGWFIRKKYLTEAQDGYVVDISGFVSNPEYRQALGLPEKVVEKYELLGQGEYNINYVTLHPITGRKLVLRVSCGSQMHLDDQIRYEADALMRLEKSGRTPQLLYVDDSEKYIKHGVLVMSCFEGEYPDYNNDSDMRAVLECLADIHCTDVDPEGLVAPERPLAAILDECEEMFSVYVNSEIAPADNKKRIRELLDCAWQIAGDTYDDAAKLSYRCCINTELNSANFLIEHRDGYAKGRLVDWEKPLYGDPAQDIGHLLAPTTTFWRTDVIYSQERVDQLIDEYIRIVGDRYDTYGLKERTGTFIAITCLRGVTWCAMAWVQYRTGEKLLRNKYTEKKLDAYMSMSFLDDIYNNYLSINSAQ